MCGGGGGGGVSLYPNYNCYLRGIHSTCIESGLIHRTQKLCSEKLYRVLMALFPLPAITCSDLSDPQYGSVSTTGNRVGDLADYECDSGFRLKGDLQRVCLSSGEWSGVPPTCAGEFYVALRGSEEEREGARESEGEREGARGRE